MKVGDEVTINCRVPKPEGMLPEVWDVKRCKGRRAKIVFFQDRNEFGLGGGSVVRYQCLSCNKTFVIST